MTELDVVRTNSLVDPTLHIWGWEVSAYLFLGGLAAGVMILTALLGSRLPGPRSRAMRWLPFAAPVLLSVGMLCLLLDLEHKRFVYRFYLAWRLSSPMSWGSWILLAIYPATVMLGLMSLTDAEIQKLSSAGRFIRVDRVLTWLREYSLRHEVAVRWTNIGLGSALGIYTGILLSTLSARPAWNSALLGPLFLVSGVSAGAALLLLFGLASEESHAVRRWDLAAIGIELMLLALYLIGLASGSAASQTAADLFLGGRYTATFWSVVVIAGLAVPFALELLEGPLKLRAAIIAPLLVLLGGLALRWIVVAAGQA
jgi:protein NrfD